jgi:hypothetical protein
VSGSSRLLDTQTGNGLTQEFLMSPAMLDAVSPTGDRGGMMLGSSMQGEPMTISALRPTPTRLVLVGGLYLARQVALRAMAVGAWVVIATGRPGSWQVLQKAAGTGPDGRPAPLELVPPRSPWQTTVYVLPYMHPQAGATANAADLVLLQRLPVGQAQLAARVWRLPPPMVHELTTLADEEVVALGHMLWKRMRLITNTKEQQILGPVRRGD